LETDVGPFSKAVIVNAYFNEAITLPSTQNYLLTSWGTQTTRIDPSGDTHAFDDNGIRGLALRDLWFDHSGSSGGYDVLHLNGSEIFLDRLDLESNNTGGVRNIVRAVGGSELKMSNCHLQGSTDSGFSFYLADTYSRVDIDGVDDTTGDNWQFEARANDIDRLHLSDIEVAGDLFLTSNPPNYPRSVTVSGLTVGGDVFFQGRGGSYSNVVARTGKITFSGQGKDQVCTGVGIDSSDVGVMFRGGVSDSTFIGHIDNPAGFTVEFQGASDCTYIGPVENGIAWRSGQTDCDVHATNTVSGSVDVAGTRPRFRGVIGGGPIGGVDLSSTTGQFVGDRAMSDGTNTTANLLATWTGSAWQPSDGGATI
jgi:hypothetical protein